MTDAERAEQLANAGDVMAEILGFTVAAMEGDREFTPKQYGAARRAILSWHRIRALAART